MKLKISKTLSKLPKIDYRTLQDLQGNLKDLTNENYEKLKRQLEGQFDFPLMVWQGHIFDGHQRLRVLKQENAQPYMLPYIEIEAENMIEAKQKLLALNSQFGRITKEGFDEFTSDLDDEFLQMMTSGFEDWFDKIDAEKEIQDYSEKNKEIDVNEFENTMYIKLKFTESDYHRVVEALQNKGITGEKALFDYLELEENES